jgi:DNA replication protein DnaC
VDDEIEQLLKNLGLHRIREVWDREMERATTAQSSYRDVFARLLREQYSYRRERSMAYRIEQARLPERWSLDTFPFHLQPGVSPAAIKQLAELDFVLQCQNLVFIGPTGVGKTGLAVGLLLRAMENGYRGLFVAAQDLFDEMWSSLADRSTRQLLNRLRNVGLLLIDEMGYLNLRPEQTNIFFKLMEERYTAHKPTIITTNLDYDDWYGFLGHKDMVAALLDRVRHRCQTVRIEGPSLRDPSTS